MLAKQNSIVHKQPIVTMIYSQQTGFKPEAILINICVQA